MKESIRYFYNVYPEKIYEIENGCYFFNYDFKYYFIKYTGNINNIELLVKITNDLYNKGILVDTFILSKDKTFHVNIDNEIYIMLRVNSIESDTNTLKDIVYFNNLLISDEKYRLNSDWASLWEKKIDEFEISISEINDEYPLIQESFSYYVGLAENAISYFKDTINEEDISKVKINLNHRRIDANATSANLNNPLTFTFDYEVRDIAEYIKAKFFNGIIDFDEIDDLFLSNNFNRVSLRILFSRLLYPSYYFDELKNIFIYDESEEKLKKYIDKCSIYEDFLIDIYNLINKQINIPPLEWLIKE